MINYKVIYGGSWIHGPNISLEQNRGRYNNNNIYFIGFRLTKKIKQ